MKSSFVRPVEAHGYLSSNMPCLSNMLDRAKTHNIDNYHDNKRVTHPYIEDSEKIKHLSNIKFLICLFKTNCFVHFIYYVMHSEQLEVLNISNVNASGQTVLNDEKLLELIQIYPFLYNPDVKPFQDPDYDEWAWMNIAKALNKTYTTQGCEEQFSVPMLINRWQLLQPIILSLSKSYDINAIPSILRQHVISLSQHLEKERPDIKPKPFSSAQNIILENIEMVEWLPLEYRQKLEAEMMSLILKTELDTKATVAEDPPKIELECKNFFKEIGLNYQYDNVNGKWDSNTNNLTQMVSLPDFGKTMITTNKHIPFTLKNDVKNEPRDDLFTPYEEMDQLLVPLDRPQWVPIDQASLYTRSCVVRIKRLKYIPDDIPLARIKKENCW